MDATDIDIDHLERRILRVENWLILLSIAAIATADYFVGRERSLGPLYLIPLSYSALTNRAVTTILLFVLCIGLRQTFGPLQEADVPWVAFFRDLGIAGIFVITVIYLGKLGRDRRLFFDLARRQRDELGHEVDVAGEVQRRLLALCEVPKGELDVAARTEQLRSVGGDYYDFMELDGGRSGVVIADVSGKGLQAALFMPAVRIALRSIVGRIEEPSEIVRELNTVLFDSTEVRHYATLFYASVDPKTGAIGYVNGGHLPALLVTSEGGSSWLDRGGTPVGLLQHAEYKSGKAVLADNGVLVLYTDGVTEAPDANGAHFGPERLERVVLEHRSEHASDIVAALEAAIARFSGAGERTDDTTLIVVKRRAVASGKGG